MNLTNLEFSGVCLQAASELAKQAAGGQADQAILGELSSRLRKLIGADYASENLQENHLGLIWDVVRQFYIPDTNSFNLLVETASDLANQLEKENLTQEELEKLFELCLALHSAAISGCMTRDVPIDHPDLVTFA